MFNDYNGVHSCPKRAGWVELGGWGFRRPNPPPPGHRPGARSLTRILLVVALSNLGSSIGTVLAAVIVGSQGGGWDTFPLSQPRKPNPSKLRGSSPAPENMNIKAGEISTPNKPGTQDMLSSSSNQSRTSRSFSFRLDDE